jgi:uncharacterized protein
MHDMTARPEPGRIPSCPICGKSAEQKYRPFCSKRCADVDLNRWLSGSYVVPGQEVEDEDGLGEVRREDDPS